MAAAAPAYVQVLLEEKTGGFDFTNFARNGRLLSSLASKRLEGKNDLIVAGALASVPSSVEGSGVLPSRLFRKTGTTICGVVTADAVVIGADTRATEGPIVADKYCQKLHRLADNIWTAGAGVAGDLDHTTKLMESKLELLRLFTRRQVRVSSAVSMLSQKLFSYQGHITCALVLGGVDCKGPQLVKIHPHGSTDRLPFCAMGSGSLNALAKLEEKYKDDMTVQEGMDLVASAIRAGIFNDLGSGGNVDLVVIRANGNAELLRGYDTPNPRPYLKQQPVSFVAGTTPVLKEEVESLLRSAVEVVEEKVLDRDDDSMRDI